jgi:hypothetical protein
MRLGVLLCAIVAASVFAMPADSRTNTPMTVRITACKSVTPKYVCVGRYSLGIPASSPSVRFFVETWGDGWTKGGTFSLDVLDAQKQPLTDPFTTKLPKAFPKGFLWSVGLDGPFPKISVYLQPKWNGKPVGAPSVARFV